jgi:hypothetical protein
MSPPRVFTDFQDLDDQNRLRLTCPDTLQDLARQDIQLHEGLHLTFFTYDANVGWHVDEILAKGVVHFSDEEHCWVATIDWMGLHHASDEPELSAKAPMIMNGDHLPLSEQKTLLRVLAVIAAAAVLGVYVWTTRPHKLSYSLHDPNPAYRAAAVRALNPQGNEEDLVEALKDEDRDIRLIALEKLGGKGIAKAKIFVSLLEDERPSVRQEAAWRLAAVGPDAWPTIEKALLHESPTVRAGAALAISIPYGFKGEFHSWPSQELEIVTPILEKLKTDTDPEVRKNVGKAIKCISRKSR